MVCRRFPMVLFFLFLTAILFGETSSFILRNHENIPFLFIVDPQRLRGINPASSYFYPAVKEFFQKDASRAKFQFLPGSGSIRVANMLVGDHIVVGYFNKKIGNSPLFPVRVMGITVSRGMKEQIVTIEKEPVLLKIQLSERKSLTDKWRNIPNMVSFSANFKPLYFYREDASGYKKLPIALSRFWKKGGTEPVFIRMYRKGDELFIRIKVRGKFLGATSYYFYIYPDRSSKENIATLEIKPLFNDKEGGIALWLKDDAGKTTPQYAGSVELSRGDSKEEELFGTVDLKKIPGWLSVASLEGVSANVSSCYYDDKSGMYEEYPLSIISLKDIPVIF